MLKCDDRFARQNRGGPPPEFPLASPSSSIVHHLSGPIGRAPTRTALDRGTVCPRCAAAKDDGSRPLHFRWASGSDLPRTRAHVRLLGPCFKTGPMRPPPSLSLRVVPGGRAPESGVRVRRRGRDSFAEGSGRAPAFGAGRKGRRVAPHPSSSPADGVSPSTPFRSVGAAAWAWIRTVSRTLELSFQSSFHLSLAVLVRYRSRARIEPWMESTTRLWAAIPSNPTLGVRSSTAPVGGPRGRGSHPLRRSLPRDSEGRRTRPIASLASQLARGRSCDFQAWAGSRFTRRY